MLGERSTGSGRAGRFVGLASVATVSVAVALLAWAPPVAARDGEWVDFHGWCPDSSCYAYTMVAITTKGERQKRTEEHRLVTLSRKGRPRVQRFASMDQLIRKGRVATFVGAPAPSERLDEETVRFPLEDGRTLAFELVLGRKLGYRVTASAGAQPREVAAGTYDDLYASTDAFAYVSPDGAKLALLVYGETPWRVRGEVHFMRLPDAPRTAATAIDETEGATDPTGSSEDERAHHGDVAGGR